MRRAGVGERGPLWITAGLQTQGRGRSGRAWASAGDSLAGTLLFAPSCPITALPQLSLVSGVAAHDAITSVLPSSARTGCRLKWPNDVLIDGAKVSGILVESTILAGVPVVAIGTGINVRHVPSLDDRPVTALAAHGATAEVAEVGRALAHALAHWIAVWDAGAGFAAIREAWLGRAGPEGEPMSIHADGERISGRFAGLDADGGLLLDDQAGERRKFSFGDVALGAPRV
jgi:BirA family transcriptional regulator, biotin operon repressor / biotin---[acetyl-CoA-carboxylase] ligase